MGRDWNDNTTPAVLLFDGQHTAHTQRHAERTHSFACQINQN